MPPENPYAAPQVVDQPTTDQPVDLPILVEEVIESLESIRDGARLGLKSLWLVLFFWVAVAARLMLPEIRGLMGWGILFLIVAAMFCLSINIVVWYRVHPAASIRKLLRIAAVSFGLLLAMNVIAVWYKPLFEDIAWIAWIALNTLLSMSYTVAYFQAAARLAMFVQDRAAARSAKIAAWSWGGIDALSGAFILLAPIPEVRELILWTFTVGIYNKELQPALIVCGFLMCLPVLIGLAAMIRALWRLKSIEVT